MYTMSSLQFLLASALVALACSYDPAYLVSTSYSQQYPKTDAVPVYCNRRTDPEYIADPKTCNSYYKCRYGKYEYRQCYKEHRYDALKGDCVRDKSCVNGNAVYSTSNTYGTSTTKAPSSTYINPVNPPFNPYTAANTPNNYPAGPTNLPYNYPMNYPTNPFIFDPIKQPDPVYNSPQGTNGLSPNNYQPFPGYVPPNYPFPPNYYPTDNYPINLPNPDSYPNPNYPPAPSNQPNYNPINNYPINEPNFENYMNPIYPNNPPNRAYNPNPSIYPAPSNQPNYNPSDDYPINVPKRVYYPKPSNPVETFNQQPYPYANGPTRNYQPETPYVDPNEDPAFLPHNLDSGYTSDAAEDKANNADDSGNNEEPYDTTNEAQNYNPPQTSNVAPPSTYPASASNVDPSDGDQSALNELFNTDNAPTPYKGNTLNCKDITVNSDYSNAQPNVPGVYPCNADLQCKTYAIIGSCKGYFLCWNNESIYQECPENQSFNATSGLCVNNNTCK